MVKIFIMITGKVIAGALDMGKVAADITRVADMGKVPDITRVADMAMEAVITQVADMVMEAGITRVADIVAVVEVIAGKGKPTYPRGLSSGSLHTPSRFA
jgi:hypothetical protein